MPFRPPPFQVQPLSTGAVLSKTLAGVLNRFRARKNREEQERKDLLAALQLQELKQKNAASLEQLKSFFRGREDEAQFAREAPEREEEKRVTGLETLEGLGRNFDLTPEQIRQSQVGERITGPLKRKPFRPAAAAGTAARKKSISLGDRTIPQLIDDFKSSSKVAVRDKEGKLTGKREFATPEHEQYHNFTKDILELRKAGLSDADLERVGMTPDDAINLKKRFIFPTLDKSGKRVMQQKLTKPEIVKLIRAGINLEMIDNAIETLRQRPEYSRFTNEMLLKLILKSI